MSIVTAVLLGATLDQVVAERVRDRQLNMYGKGVLLYRKEKGGRMGRVRFSLQECGRPVEGAYLLVSGHSLHFLHVDKHGNQEHAAHAHNIHIHRDHTCENSFQSFERLFPLTMHAHNLTTSSGAKHPAFSFLRDAINHQLPMVVDMITFP